MCIEVIVCNVIVVFFETQCSICIFFGRTLADRVSRESKAIGSDRPTSVRPSVRPFFLLFPLYLLNRLIFELTFLYDD